MKNKTIEQKCEICGDKINVCETALKLCDKCFSEKCVCGHIRAHHIQNTDDCIFTFGLTKKNIKLRGKSCQCKKFIKN